MKILIIENEIYLAQSIATKLTALDSECKILTRLDDVLSTPKPDIVLLSTNIFGENIYEVIKHFNGAIIILLVSYISNDTVSKPLKAGASDYIQKPFMVEELLRKINHFIEFKRLKERNLNLSSYLDFLFLRDESKKFEFKNLKFPLFIRANSQFLIDEFVYKLSKERNLDFSVVFLDKDSSLAEIERSLSPIYAINFYALKERENFYKIIKNRTFIVSAYKVDDEIPFETLNLENESSFSISDEILTIDEYFKFIIKNFQDRLPDTELAKRLGISRKSLWEKRKKYEITKGK